MNKNEILEDLLDAFNFEAVHDIMVKFNWEWYSCNGVPSVRQLELRVIEMFNYIWDKVVEQKQEEFYTATGGFEVSGYKTDDETVPYAFTVKFILEEVSNY